jgi:MFS family permease
MALNKLSIISRRLEKTSTFWFTVYASISAFCLYTCIYAFRKTFTAATFEDFEFAGYSYKVWLVTFQVLGYGMAKFFGIKFIAELKPGQRTGGILLMVSIAALAWLLFAIVPKPYNILFLFMNGFPLGLVWGMVFGFLEGRRMTEVLGAALSVSFIFSAGLCRSVGAYLMQDWNVTETWMPFTACLVFLIPLLVFLWLLDKLPPPTALDESLRTKRQPMNGAERKNFLQTFLPGIVLFVLAYMLLTAFRDFRENFASDVWKSLGYGNLPGIYTKTETPVSILVLIIMGSIMLIKNNKTALMVNHLIIIAGMLLIGISTFLFESQLIDAPLWMILIGVGLYLGYVPFNSIFFDRLIAAFRYVGTVGFIMYIADAFGYLGSITVLFVKEFSYTSLSWVEFFINGGYILSATGTLLIFGSMLYFHRKHTMVPHRSAVLASGEETTSPL